ncbi:hypothetical protein FACS1894132_02250 [Clostridia bacterium]|nr:hypothetical protein FACS1894132_02250 [Clostridia bacterium]
MRGKYIAKRRLEELDRLLSERDKAVLRSLEKCRYLLTGQIRRLHFTDSKTETAGLRAASRVMVKLRDFGMADALERRIGGVRAGSGSYAWTLTESGGNLLNLRNTENTQRKRSFEPSLNFMKHTLEVSETYVQLTEICRQNHLELLKTEMEPECWRPYTGEDGKPASMKPDMFAVTANGEYEDSWFIEVDMNTESPSVVLDKCRRYTHYCASGAEQKQHEVFPLVVWLAYSENRENKLKQYIDDCREISEKSKGIFVVIMPTEFETLVRNGAGALGEKKGDEK